jgi:pimeloyl-ACP methyl ester carboxylesterase
MELHSLAAANRPVAHLNTLMLGVKELAYQTGNSSHPMSAILVSCDKAPSGKLPVVMIHGGFHTGLAYLQTPDDRAGWAHLMAKRGHEVIVPDWPAHGRSPGLESIEKLGTLDVARSLGALLESVGKCILVAHSAGGPLAWWLAEQHPDLVVAILGIAPGPPANMLPDLPDDPIAVHQLRFDPQAGCPVYSSQDSAVTVDVQFIKAFWANSLRFPMVHLDSYVATIVPESPRVLNERFNIGGAGLRLRSPELVAQRHILIVTGDRDLRHPKQVDAALADYLSAEFIWLADRGITGNGHMLMIEDNSHDIADLLMQWLMKKGL